AQNNNKTLTAVVDAYLAESALSQGEPADALRHATSACRVFSRQAISYRAASAKLLVARAAYEMGNLPRAARMARAAREAVEGLYAPAVAYQSHHLLGRIERRRERKPAALDHFRRAIEVIEQMRGGVVADEFKATFLRDKIAAYEDAIAACLDADEDELIAEAFRFVESSKSRALADLLARYVRQSPAGSATLKPETRERLRKLIE